MSIRSLYSPGRNAKTQAKKKPSTSEKSDNDNKSISDHTVKSLRQENAKLKQTVKSVTDVFITETECLMKRRKPQTVPHCHNGSEVWCEVAGSESKDRDPIRLPDKTLFVL